MSDRQLSDLASSDFTLRLAGCGLTRGAAAADETDAVACLGRLCGCPGNSPTPENRWRSHAHLLFGNWLNEVYQHTPYDLEKVGK